MLGRFPILTDEHVPNSLVRALRDRGWSVHRVIDEPGLGRRASDQRIFAYAAEKRWVWLSRDERALRHPKEWQAKGLAFVGMLCWPQRHRGRMSVGDVVQFLESLAEESDPFASGVRHIKPGQ